MGETFQPVGESRVSVLKTTPRLQKNEKRGRRDQNTIFLPRASSDKLALLNIILKNGLAGQKY